MCWSKTGDVKVKKNVACKKCEGNIGEAVEQEDKSCDKVNTNELTYLGDRVSAHGGCEAAVTVGIKCVWVKFNECGEYGMRFPVGLKGAVCMSYARLAILYGSKALYE